MKQEIGKALLVVFMEPGAEVEAEFNQWYDAHHVPERVSVPGFLGARRYELCEGEGALKYLAIYELEDEGVLQSEAYLELREKSTPMNFEHPKVQRLVYRQIFPETGAFETKSGPHAAASGS
jgi:hypothetical protein